jgi:hypothetical protein
MGTLNRSHPVYILVEGAWCNVDGNSVHSRAKGGNEEKAWLGKKTIVGLGGCHCAAHRCRCKCLLSGLLFPRHGILGGSLQ